MLDTIVPFIGIAVFIMLGFIIGFIAGRKGGIKDSERKWSDEFIE